MFSGRNSHTSPPQNAPQGFAAFAPPTNSFQAMTATTTPHFRLDSSVPTSVSRLRGFANFDSSSSVGFPFGRADPSAATVNPPCIDRVTTAPRLGPGSGGFISGVDAVVSVAPTNSFGRGLTTHTCFAANDDQRFTQPAFQSATPSVWPTMATKSTTSNLPPPSHRRTVFGVPSTGLGSATTTTTWGTPGLTNTSTSGQLIGRTSIVGRPSYEHHFVEAHPLSSSSSRASQWTSGSNTTASRFTFGPSRSDQLTNTTGAFRFGSDQTIDRGSERATPFLTGLGGHVDSVNPFARSNGSTIGSDKAVSSPSPFVFEPSTATTTTPAQPTNPFAMSHSRTKAFVPEPFPLVFARPKELVSGPTLTFGKEGKSTSTESGFRFDWNQTGTSLQTATPQPATLSILKTVGESVEASRSKTSDFMFSFPPLTTSTQPRGVTDAEIPLSDLEHVLTEVVSRKETASGQPSDDKSGSLALPPLTPSYSTISGSRAKAFVRRAGNGRQRAFVTQSSRLAVAKMTATRKPSSLAAKPIDRIVVGRSDAELWKRSKFQFKTSLFAQSAHAMVGIGSSHVTK